MVFQHTLEAVLNESKTQTSRIVKPGGYLAQGVKGNEQVSTHNKRGHKVK